MKHILYIEDEEDYQLLVTRILGHAGLDVVTADTGREGLERLAQDPPDLLLLDINLPDTDGYTLCQTLRENPAWHNLPILMLTVRRRPDEWLRGFAYGANDYVSKPINPPELLERILRGLEHQAPPVAGEETAEYKLVQAAAAGNRSAFESLIRQHRERLTERLRHIMSQPSLVEDVVAQAFLAAYKNLHRFRGASSFYTWLYRIALNEAQNLQKKSRFFSYDKLTHNDDYILAKALPRPRPAEEAAHKASHERALAALARVKQPYRRMLRMFVMQELAYDAIAKRLRIPVGTVMSRLHKARQLLQQAWRKTTASS